MLDGKRFYIFLALYFVILLIPAYWLPLFETTDARYAEISREMLSSGNFLEPYYNGIKHFHKPPFAYWMNALGMGIFGINGFGVRFFGSVAAVLIILFTKKLSFLLTDDKKIADTSVFILSSSVLFLIVSRVVSTDIYLVLFTVMALYYIFKQIYDVRSMSNALLIGLFLGLGFMAKGPIIFLFTLLPLVTAMIFDRAHRRVFSFSQLLACIIVFVLVALPWYVYVVGINDGLLNYFLKDQTVDRVATNKFSRSKPFYFFFGVFFITFAPWVFYFIRNHKFLNKLKTGKLLYLYVLMPFIVFQISTSKLGTYLLPFYPVAALIAAVNADSKIIRTLSSLFLVLLGVAVCAVPFVIEYTKPYAIFMILFGVAFTGTSLVLILKGLLKREFVKYFSILLLVASLAAFCFVPFIGPYVKGYRLISEDIKDYNSNKNLNVLLYKAFTPSVSFYLNDVKPIAFDRERETQFQKYEDYKRFLIQTDDELDMFISNNKELLLVSRNNSHVEFEKRTGYKCVEVSLRGGNKSVSHCKSP
ncbi:MAG: phospholipid carrier-dependent glycosyltransferase [Denitrovibrio sp.]|nr:MAG: phospholipid carrier-dependent glycosyltransferase [Denitrovibrio sp.]